MIRFAIRILPSVAFAAACSNSDVLPTQLSTDVLPAMVADQTIQVSSAADAGPGSLRAAIGLANAAVNSSRIVIRPGLSSVTLAAPLVYSGAQPLAIVGHGVTLDGSGLAAGESAFTATGGGDLDLSRLTVQNAPGTGITVAIPNAAVGSIRVALTDVTVRNNGSHGLLVNDQLEYFTDEFSTSANGSAASLDVQISDSRFTNNGRTARDRDGLRLNEGGDGDLRVNVRHTLIEANGGDGAEFDERGTGSVLFDVQHTTIIANGDFDVAIDPDDGLDIDEAGDGDIVGRFTHVDAHRNFEQGLDLNENDAGDLKVDLLHVSANDNAEEGIEYEEDDDFAGGGDIVATVRHVTTLRNGAADGDAGLKLREKGTGNLDVRLDQVVSSGNLIGGILLREDAAGNLVGTASQASTEGNGADGIEFDENGSGDLTAEVRQSLSRNNADAGIDADQAGAGTGSLTVINLTGGGNGDGDVEVGGTVLTTTP